MEHLPKLSRRHLLGGTCATVVTALVPPGAALAGDAPSPAKSPTKPREARTVEWEELLPEKERLAAQKPVATIDDYLGGSGASQEQTGSYATNPKLNNVFIKMPGFIVPLTVTQGSVLSDFLLVPYFGACTHVPPPPPNQIVYVKLAKPAPIKEMWVPYWITGVLTAAKQDTRIASVAYTLAGEKLELYEY